MLVAALALYVAGAFALWLLPGPQSLVGLLLLAWLAHGISGCRRLVRHYARVSAYRFDDSGALELDGGQRQSARASRLPGTVVLERAIWLRCRDEDGRIVTELFTGDPRRDVEFRRAAVLLRLLAETRKN